MAGAGYKNFNAGDVLTSADVDTYLMEQSIMVFAGTAARASAISSPSEGMFTYLSDTNTLQYYTGTAWVDSYSATNGAAVTNRNLLYNGAMQVAQRGTSTASITTLGYYTADRWNVNNSSLGTWTQSVETDAPTGSGFNKSLKMLCTTADSSPAAADQLNVSQSLEGQDLQRLKKGTSAAEQLTLSFWVKSNVTGTYIAMLSDGDNSRRVCASYAVSASATWEKKTITFPADATGALDNDNAASLTLVFWLAAGSDRTSGSLQTTWGTLTPANLAVGQTNLAAATNNYWQVTAIQLEIGAVATSFEFKSYGQELAECQRYYYLHADGTVRWMGIGGYTNNTRLDCSIKFPCTMRTDPSLVATSGTNYYTTYRAGASDDFNSWTADVVSNTGANIINTSEVAGTGGNAAFIYTNNVSAKVAFSAEL